MLMNDFYTIHEAQKTENSYSATIQFNASHNIFKGHFPGQPVVPGVCMMEIVKEILEQEIGKLLLLKKAANVKFLQLITPDIYPVINLKWEETENDYNISASFNKEASVLFKLSGSYQLK